MSLKLLLDENISQVIADQVRRNCPEISVQSVHTWQDGTFEGQLDKALLLAARAEDLTFVTYDLKTIPDVLIELYAESQSHAGVILIDNLTIPSSDFGELTRALVAFWNRHQASDWENNVLFLERAR